MKAILIIITCFLITYSTCQDSNDTNSNNGHTASGNAQTYPLNMTKQSFIFFIVGITISAFALIASLCFYNNRRRRRAIAPYSTLTEDGKIDPRMVNEKGGISMVSARNLLFPTQSHNRTTYNSKDADIPTWDRKTQVEKHGSIRLPKTAVKKWGNERESNSNRNSKTKQWLENLEQQRDQRKQWLDGIEQKREARKSWIVNISPRSTDVSVLPSSPVTTREQRRSKLLASLKQRETNPDADKGEVKETLRNSNRKSWNPELAKRESGKSLTRSQRKSYRASMIEGDKRLERDINGYGNEDDKEIELERERAYVAQPAKKQTLFGEGGAMWETVLERV